MRTIATRNSWAEQLIGAVDKSVPQSCADVDVEKDGLLALCVDCREGFRMSRLGMSPAEAKTAGLQDELERQQAEEKAAKFPWSLRQSIEKVCDLELESQEAYEILATHGQMIARAVHEELKPITRAAGELMALYQKVTGFEYVSRSAVVMELGMRRNS